MEKQLLQNRLSIVILREGYTFLNKFTEFQIALKKYFKHEYTLDEIESGLHQLEENYIIDQAREDEIMSSINTEVEEDSFNN